MDAAREPPIVFAPAAWTGLAALYLLFAGQVSSHEVIAGLGASVAACAYATVAHHASAPMQLRLPWVRVVGSVIGALVLDTVRVGFALVRGAPGSLSGQKLPNADAGQLAVAILALSAAPNGFVVRAESTDLLLHRLVGSSR